jgi:outer membrane lipoprotein-sorting protein
MSRVMSRVAALMLVLLAASLPPAAAGAQPGGDRAAAGATIHAEPWSVEQMMAAMARVRSERAYFEEEKHLAILQQPLHSTGELAYRAPDHLRKATLTPQFESLEVNGDWLQVADSSQSQQRLYLPGYPLLQALVEAVRSTMAGDLDRLARFYAIGFEGQAEAWTLRLAPNEAEVRQYLEGVVIQGRDNRIATVETREADGDRTVMTVSIISIEY